MDQISDFNAEASVIGTLMSHPSFLAHSEYLQPNYFIDGVNGVLYWAIRELYRKNIRHIDIQNLMGVIRGNKSAERVFEKNNLSLDDGTTFDYYLQSGRDTIAEYKLNVDRVVTCAFKNDLSRTLDRISSNCLSSDSSLAELNGSVYSAIDELTEKYVVTEEITTLGDNIDRIWHDIVSRRNENGMYGIPSKFKSFMDYFTYEPGELVVVQAKYKEGKSMLLLNEMVHKLEQDMSVLVVDTEMSERLYTERLLANLTGISCDRIKSGRYSEDEGQLIQDKIEWLKTRKFVYINNPNLSMDGLYSICKMVKNRMGLDFLVYDYPKSNEKTASENYNVLGAKFNYLKNNIASGLNIPVLSAYQLNRQGEIADSYKINQYLSVGIKWMHKTASMIASDGVTCGNAYAKIYVNRLGKQMMEDDEEDYLDFSFDGDTMKIMEAAPHERTTEI